MTKQHSVPLTYRDAGVDIDAGDALVDRIKPLARGDRLEVWGPLPALIARRADRHRAQLVLLCDNRKHLNHTLTRICQTLDETKLPGGLKWMIDVDPQETG